jgi:hypothetical protein
MKHLGVLYLDLWWSIAQQSQKGEVLIKGTDKCVAQFGRLNAHEYC